MEIGSFFELEFQKGKEHYSGEKVVRLNSARAGIYHATRVLGCSIIHIPYYQCETVRNYLLKKGVQIKYYSIDKQFNPINIQASDNEAILFVNYFGIMSKTRMESLSEKYKNVIIDNSQAFFTEPLERCINIYSARKFVGVSDGAYVIGECVNKFVSEYEQDFSSDTSLFLLQRIEYGCEGKAYKNRVINENKLAKVDVLKMSTLTKTILDSIDYDLIIQKRRKNFEMAEKKFASINSIDAKLYYDKTCVPMVYPLVIEEEEIIHRLLAAKHFQGHWWSYLLDETEESSFEHWLSKYVIPITIDQRYGREELNYIVSLIGGKNENCNFGSKW